MEILTLCSLPVKKRSIIGYITAVLRWLLVVYYDALVVYYDALVSLHVLKLNWLECGDCPFSKCLLILKRSDQNLISMDLRTGI